MTSESLMALCAYDIELWPPGAQPLLSLSSASKVWRRDAANA